MIYNKHNFQPKRRSIFECQKCGELIGLFGRLLEVVPFLGKLVKHKCSIW